MVFNNKILYVTRKRNPAVYLGLGAVGPDGTQYYNFASYSKEGGSWRRTSKILAVDSEGYSAPDVLREVGNTEGSKRYHAIFVADADKARAWHLLDELKATNLAEFQELTLENPVKSLTLEERLARVERDNSLLAKVILRLEGEINQLKQRPA